MFQQEAIVSINNLSFVQQQRSIFHGITMTIPRGKIVAVLGPSGAGKTTLLRLMGGQLQPSQGSVQVFGTDLNRLPQSALYQLRQRMGMLFQSPALFTGNTVYENVAFPLREHTDLPEDMIHALVLMKLQAVGLRGAAALYPRELSGGMARRVALARALALDPEIIFYDEPFSGQDPISKGVLIKLIATINRTMQVTTVIVSHDVQETLQLADYVYVLADGGIIGAGTPAELQAHMTPQIAQFIRGLPDGVIPFHYPAKSLQEDFLLGSVS